jgi:hypothetical protein
MNLGLHNQRLYVIMERYTYVDWNTLLDDSKMTSGYIYLYTTGGAVS